MVGDSSSLKSASRDGGELTGSFSVGMHSNTVRDDPAGPLALDEYAATETETGHFFRLFSLDIRRSERRFRRQHQGRVEPLAIYINVS